MRCLLWLFLFAYHCAFAQIGGKASYTFLNLTPSARTASLGGANISAKNDLSSVNINPATLSLEHNNHLSLTYFNYFNGINYGMVNYAHNTKWGMFAYALQYANYGKFIESDETGLIIGEFKASDYCLNISYAKVLNQDSSLKIGGTLKPIFSNYYTYKSVALAADFGVYYQNSEKQFGASAVIKNAGVALQQYNPAQKSKLPLNVQLGVSQGLAHLPLTFYAMLNNLQRPDLSYVDSAKLKTKDPLTGLPIKEKKNYADKIFRHFIAGAELNPTSNFSIRLAYNYKLRKELFLIERPGIVGFSFGFGFKTKKFSLDYGRTQFHRAGATHLFTFTIPLSAYFTPLNY